jgi:phosphoglycerate-specific signal transduction histidine kinase
MAEYGNQGWERVARIDERTLELQSNLKRVDERHWKLREEIEKRRESDAHDRRVSLFTMIGIAITLTSVGVSVLGLVLTT